MDSFLTTTSVDQQPKLYKDNDPMQKRLVDDVVEILVHSLIPATALADRSFDRMIKRYDPKLTVSSVLNAPEILKKIIQNYSFNFINVY